MKRNILICFLFLFATALQSSSLKEYSIEKLEKILVKEFHPYPTYGDVYGLRFQTAYAWFT